MGERIDLAVLLQTEELVFVLEKLISDIHHSTMQYTPEVRRKLKGINYHRDISKLVFKKGSDEEMAPDQSPKR